MPTSLSPYFNRYICSYNYSLYISIIIIGNEQLCAEAEKLALSCDSDHQRRMSELKSMIVQSNAISLDQVDTEFELAAAKAATCKFKERM